MIKNKSILENTGYATLLSLDYGKSSGSGFFFRSHNQDFLVTAKHVLFEEEGDGLRCESILISSLIRIDDLKEAKILCHKKHDVAVIPFGSIQDGQYEDYISFEGGANTLESINDQWIKPLNDLKIANDVFLVGYPTSLMFQNYKPLLRKGVVAGINIHDNVFIIDCSVNYGNSGSPIFELGEDNFLHLAGVVSRFIPFTIEWRNNREKSISHLEYFNSGYAICVPIDTVMNLITNYNDDLSA